MASDPQDLRIISLIPSATEIIHSLGGVDSLVGRSHACDYPSAVQPVPICTAPNLDPSQSSAQIHNQVEALLQRSLSIYQIDVEQIARLQPTHILTQAQCEVCAVSFEQVEQALRDWVDCQPQLISLQPRTIDDVWDDIRRVGDCLRLPSQATVTRLRDRMRHLQSKVKHAGITVGCIEWTQPLMAAGNWMPELVAMAGGIDLLGVPGQHSNWLTWDQLQAANPEVLIVMPCGFDLKATSQAIQTLSEDDRWQRLQAVRSHQVYLTDGNQYFNRPGPRLVDSLAILIEILQEGQQFQGKGWISV